MTKPKPRGAPRKNPEEKVERLVIYIEALHLRAIEKAARDSGMRRPQRLVRDIIRRLVGGSRVGLEDYAE